MATNQNNIDEKKPMVILFHDSLCKDINETILSNENIDTNKIWAPTLPEVQEKLEEIDKTDVIVIEPLTRHLKDMEIDSLISLISETVDKCTQKADHVIISTIIKRDDDEEIGVKAEIINANMKYKYLNVSNVTICNNDNLYDRKYRAQDGIHLKPIGTSRFASNLKYKIAESLGITVERKRRVFFENTHYNKRYHKRYQK